MVQEQSTDGNRRRFARISLSLEVKIRFDEFNTFVSAYSADLSVGGIFIKTRNPRKVGTAVKLNIDLQNGQKLIEADGRVVRVVLQGDTYTGATPGMAIEFTRLHPKSRKIIQQYIVEKTSSQKTKP